MRLNLAGRGLLGFLLFNLGWWACALGSAHGAPWLGPVLVPVFVILHVAASPVPNGELLFLGSLAPIGFFIDTALIRLGVFQVGALDSAPAWLVAMWVLHGITFENMLPMRRHWFLLALAGVISGPLTYIFCEAVNLLVYTDPRLIKMASHGLFWAGLLPLLFWLRDFCFHVTLSRQRHK